MNFHFQVASATATIMWSKQRFPGSEIYHIKYSDSDFDSINDAMQQIRWIIEGGSLRAITCRPTPVRIAVWGKRTSQKLNG